jgi:hypothetical protein
MSITWSDAVDEILRVGRTLEDIGVVNWGLTRSQALEALVQLKDQRIAILGGDVYESSSEVILPTCDNWYCDRIEGESKGSFVDRSFEKARAYIASYEPDSGRTVLFALVPDV